MAKPSLMQVIIYTTLFTSATLIGYEFGYLNGVLSSRDFCDVYGIQDSTNATCHLTASTRSLFSSILVVGTLLGAPIPPLVPDRLGKRACFAFAAISYAIGTVLQVAPLGKVAFVFGRAITGFALGLVSVTTPAYLVETSPAHIRGRLVALYQQFLTVGNVIACGISLGTKDLKDSHQWRITIAFQFVLCLFIFAGALVMTESPLTMLRLNREDAARKSLGKLRNINPNSESASEEIMILKGWIKDQKSLGSIGLFELFRGVDLRRTCFGATSGVVQIFSGDTFWFGYGTTFFQAAGISNGFLISLALALVNCAFTTPSIWLIERFGTRSCWFTGGTLMLVISLTTGILNSTMPDTDVSKNVLVAGSIMFIMAYACTLGPVGFVCMSEPYSIRLQSYSTSFAMANFWLATWFVSFVVPYMVDADAGNMGVKISYFWTGTIAIGLVWAYVCMPELAGLTRLEIDKLFQERVPAWRSKDWIKEYRSRSHTIDGVEQENQPEIRPEEEVTITHLRVEKV